MTGHGVYPNNITPKACAIVNFDHADLCTKLREAYTPKSFGENVGELSVGANELHLNLRGLSAFPNAVETNIDVIASLVENWIFSK